MSQMYVHTAQLDYTLTNVSSLPDAAFIEREKAVGKMGLENSKFSSHFYRTAVFPHYRTALSSTAIPCQVVTIEASDGYHCGLSCHRNTLVPFEQLYDACMPRYKFGSTSIQEVEGLWRTHSQIHFQTILLQNAEFINRTTSLSG